MLVHSDLNLTHSNHAYISAQPKIKQQHRSQVSLRVKRECLLVVSVSFYCKFILCVSVCLILIVCYLFIFYYFLLCYLCEL